METFFRQQVIACTTTQVTTLPCHDLSRQVLLCFPGIFLT